MKVADRNPPQPGGRAFEVRRHSGDSLLEVGGQLNGDKNPVASVGTVKARALLRRESRRVWER